MSHDLDKQDLPRLYRDRAFWGMTITQFLGAFNDNLFKQLMLLLAVPIGALAVGEDEQWLATVVFAVPFVLFSGFAGFLSDRYSKRTVIVCSKVAEIVVMLLGLGGFWMFGRLGYNGLLVVLFLMGVQSAFFGPGKYGILPEMLRDQDLPRANGAILMTTFLAIILGVASAGILGDAFVDPDNKAATAPHLAYASLICVGIAVGGTCTSLMIRKVTAARPQLEFAPDALAIPKETRLMLWHDRPLLTALIASSMFWLVSSAAMQSVNNFGLNQLQLDMKRTSLLVAFIAVGIMVGAIVAGRFSHGRADFRFVRGGSWGIIACLLVLSIYKPGGEHWLGQWPTAAVLMLLGMFAGFFAIPLQVFIQARPPEGQKGRLIAVMNQANFIAIVLSGPAYRLMDRIVENQAWPRCVVFAMIALVMAPVALFYRPRNG